MVTARRVTSAPSKAEAMSAPKAGPPVTCTSRPAGAWSATSARRSSMVATWVALSSLTSTGTLTVAAFPSSLTCGCAREAPRPVAS